MGNKASTIRIPVPLLECQTEEGRARAVEAKKNAEELLQTAKDTVSETDLAEIQRLYEQNGPSELSEAIFKNIDRWKTTPLNIAVFGPTGSGKSTYINVARGLKSAECEGAARTGVTECTLRPEPYPHPDNPMLVYWDLPGVGTSTFPKDKYMEKVDLNVYDFFLIVSSKRFREEDAWFGQQIQTKLRKTFFYVRTHINADVTSELSDYPSKYRKLFEEQSTNNSLKDPSELEDLFKEHATRVILTDIREKTTKCLEVHGNAELFKIFLVDSKDPGNVLYDFTALQDSILNNLEPLKRDVFLLSLSVRCEQDVLNKVKFLENRAWKIALASGALGLFPLPGVPFALNAALIVSTSVFFHEQLGLNRKPECAIAAEDTQCAPDDVPTVIDADWVWEVAVIQPQLKTRVTGEAAKGIPILGTIDGMIAGPPVSYIATRDILRAVLFKMETAAMAKVHRSIRTYKELLGQAPNRSRGAPEIAYERPNAVLEAEPRLDPSGPHQS